MMKSAMTVYHSWLCGVCVCLVACQTPDASISEEGQALPLFQLLDSSSTGIDFVNQVDNQENFNILTYRNYYNGGGVAIGDVNQDGLLDLFFSANMRPNRLYLNRGNWRFEDVTEAAKVGGTRAWSTGITMVDINADGLLDLYVCNSGDVAGGQKENELFVNQGPDASGISVFEERAAAYGLNDAGMSTHATFFDYDLDGDLDAYLLNNSIRDPARIDLTRAKREEPDLEGGDKLYRNEGPGQPFTDVTVEAGIYSSAIGFGLGVSAGDVNGDHLPDLFVSNDFWERDYLYINQGDGTFSEELMARMGHTSMNSMGADIGDLNNDGAPEVFSTDMLPASNYRLKAMTQFEPVHLENRKNRANYHYQYLQNSLQLNQGDGNFQEIAFLSGVAATDWSWGALMFDFDNDGWKDLFVSNGIYHDITYQDFVSFISDRNNIRDIVTASGTFDFRDFLPHLPSNPQENFAFVNEGDLRFRLATRDLGLDQQGFSNGAAYGDLDGDGDLDLVVNNVNMAAFVYRNQARERTGVHYLKVAFKGPTLNPFGVGAEVRIHAGGMWQMQQQYPTRGFESAVAPTLLFGLGSASRVDTLEVIWPDRRRQIRTQIGSDQELVLDYAGAVAPGPADRPEPVPLLKARTSGLFVGDTRHHENTYNDFDYERLLPRMLSAEGPRAVKGDVNGDGLTDLLLLGAKNDPDKLFLQQADGRFALDAQPAFTESGGQESTCAAFFDREGDGDLDLLIGSGGNEFQLGMSAFLLRYYENDGKGAFTLAPAYTPPAGGMLSCIVPEDFDQDGDPDLFIGGRAVPGNYGLVPASFLIRNDGDSWTPITPQSIGTAGMVTDAAWADIDQDGWSDLIVVGEWMPILVFRNLGQELAAPEAVPGSEGWWTRILPSDLDADGDPDFVLGNWGTNTKFKASPGQPLSLLVKDFDQNKKSEFILNWYPPAETTAYPFPSRMDLTEQLPHLKKRILKYEDFARMRYEELFTREEQQGVRQFSAEYLESTVLWNRPEGFMLQALPREAQVAPTFGIIAEDLDQDGFTDLLLGGNFYGLKPEVGRHDAHRGLLLKGNGAGTWKPIPPQRSGILLDGEVRDLVYIRRKDLPPVVVAARNDQTVLAFECP